MALKWETVLDEHISADGNRYKYDIRQSIRTGKFHLYTTFELSDDFQKHVAEFDLLESAKQVAQLIEEG